MTSDVNRLLREHPHGRPRRGRLAEGVVAALVETIVSGRATPGSVLPPEGVLAESFGVSRITAREAVKLAEARGLVTVRQGVGTVVQPPESWDLLSPDVLAQVVRHDAGLEVLDELVRVRLALESMLAAEAATRATAADHAALREVFDRLERDVERPLTFIDTDLEFHERIMAASGSRLARTIVRTVHVQARTSQLYSGQPTVAGCRTSNGEHLVVLDRLLARDAPGVAAAMERHIWDAWTRRRPDPRAAP